MTAHEITRSAEPSMAEAVLAAPSPDTAPEAESAETAVLNTRESVERSSMPLIRRPYYQAQNKTYQYKGRTYAIEGDEVFRAEDHSRSGKWYGYDKIRQVNRAAVVKAVLKQRDEDEAIREARKTLAKKLAQGDAAFEQVLCGHLDCTDGVIERPCFLDVIVEAPPQTIPGVAFFRVYTEMSMGRFAGAHEGRLFYADMEFDDYLNKDYDAIQKAVEAFPLNDTETAEEAMERLQWFMRSLLLRISRSDYSGLTFFFDKDGNNEDGEFGDPNRIVHWFHQKMEPAQDFKTFRRAWLNTLQIPVLGFDCAEAGDACYQQSTKHAFQVTELAEARQADSLRFAEQQGR